MVYQNGERHALELAHRNGRLWAAGGPDQAPEWFTGLDSRPVLEIEPLALGPSKPLSEATLRRIQGEVAARHERDQEALRKKVTDQDEPGEVATVTAENTAYLVALVQEVGWIDRARFGLETAHRATVLAQHSDHLPLGLAALPGVEKDFKGAADSPETYPIFVDWLRLALGQCQIYGSRIELDMEGDPVLAPLEDPERVDERRATQGLPPLDEYLALAAKYLFKGRAVRREPGSSHGELH